MLELMRFPSELIDVSEFKAPAEKSVGKAEMQMPEQLIESMTTEWEPEQYSDEYRDALENSIEKKIEHGDKAAPAPSKKTRPSNVVDLVSVLQESIQQSQGKAKVDKPVMRTRATSKKAPRKKAA
jgi:DNA end-binding protein Ku